MTEKEKMINGYLYHSDPELKESAIPARELIRNYNNTAHNQREERERILKKLFKSSGNKVYIEPPFRCDFGYNISVGENFYANYECIILDECPVTIGNNVLLAPRVGIYSVGHPIDAGVRNAKLNCAKPITIGNDVWIGAHTVINPGVTIGNNVVIGSGSVVTRDIPDNVVAVGNPCRVLREITDEDKKYWENLRDNNLKW